MMRTAFLTILFLVAIITTTSAQNNLWYTFPSGVPENANRYIYVDDNDTKWIGGYSNGMHKFNNSAWTHYTTGISDPDVRQSCFDTLGNLWIATWKKLSKYTPSTNTWTSFNVTGQSLDILYSVQVDKQNRIWVGTDGGADPDDGLYMYDGTTWTFYNPTNSPLTGRWITALRKDLTGKIWGGTANGLFEINNTTITTHSLQSAGFPAGTMATSIDMDSYNNKWVGVYGGGVGKFNGTSWTIYTPANSPLPENKVWSLAVDQNNVVWIGTETKGLVKFDGTNWTIYNTTNSSITNNRIDALAVDKLNNLWIAPNYGGIVVHNSQGISGINGYVYYDKNSNGVKEANEPLLPNQVIKISNTNLYSITGSAGTYSCPVLNSGSYYAKPVKTAPYIISSAPDSIGFTISNTATSLPNKNFGIRLQPNVHDIAIDYISLNAPRPGFPYTAYLTASNIGSLRSDSITLKLNHDPNLILDSTSYAYQVHQGDSIVWKIDSLTLFQKKPIRLYFHVPANVALLGTNLINDVYIKDKFTDINIANNYRSSSEIIVGAYDPNDKKAEPAGNGPAGEIPPGTQDLTYTIRFQNTGSAPAQDIVIKDTLSSFVDVSSIQMISSSHAYNARLKNGGIVWWEFNNINLPDSNQNEPASHGYIKYKVNLKPNLAIGTQIKNTGYIYFDFNPAIVTNTALNTIYSLSTGLTDHSAISDGGFVVYPNPAQTSVTVLTNKKNEEDLTVNIFNSTGKLVYHREHLDTEEFSIDISQFANDIYCVQLNGKTINQQKKFAKIN
jgi:hypothetical protein